MEPSQVFDIRDMAGEAGDMVLRRLVQYYIHDKATVSMIVEALPNTSQMGMKRKCIEDRCPAPSVLGDISKWDENCRKLQIKCHRPAHGMHVTLQIGTFGTFMDNIEREDIPDYKFVDCVLQVMSSAHLITDEGAKTEATEQANEIAQHHTSVNASQ